jgi:hypothetical protein
MFFSIFEIQYKHKLEDRYILLLYTKSWYISYPLMRLKYYLTSININLIKSINYPKFPILLKSIKILNHPNIQYLQ